MKKRGRGRPRRVYELDKIAVRIRLLFARRGVRCWRRALGMIARAPVDEIIVRLGVALRVATRDKPEAVRSLARDGYLCAGARLWWYRSETRAGDAETDLLDGLNRAWAAVAAGVHEDDWYKARLDSSAYFLAACGLPPELIPAATAMAEPGIVSHDE